MNPGDRRRRPPSGFPDFAAHPFFGGGMGMGMMGGSSFFNDFFGRDPFDDPFFTRPMGMAMPGGGLFGQGPMGMGMDMDSFFARSGFFSRPDGSLLDQQRPFRLTQPQPESRRGPVIEELLDDNEEASENKNQYGQEPIVEHPEDEEILVGSASQGEEQLQQSQSSRPPSNRSHHHQLSRSFQPQSNRNHHHQSNNGYQSNSSYQSYNFQSSSMSYGGPGGSYYSSSSMRRVGPDGVIQEEHIERDSSGKEVKNSARGLRDKVHAISKKRNVMDGPETTVETLHNLTPEEAPHFDAQWEASAQRNLPGWSRGRSQMLEGNTHRSTFQVAPALPYNEEGFEHRMPRS